MIDYLIKKSILNPSITMEQLHKMKQLILTISLILGATASIAGSYIKYYEFPKKDCQEMFAGIGGLLEEADKEWAYLEENPQDSPDAFEHAAKIQWLTGLAANYTTIFEAFCDKD